MTTRSASPFELAVQMTLLWHEAATVMALRTSMLCFTGAAPTAWQKTEANRMWVEKAAALRNSACAAAANPDSPLEAALAPFAKRIRSNRNRLTKRALQG